jgi:hypothetical protein
MMSVPHYSDLEMEMLLVGLNWLVLSNLVTPTVAGDDQYMAMIRLLPFLADRCNKGEVIQDPDLEVVD